MNLSEKLVSARKSKDISQKDMAAKLGISVASLNRYEGGIREIEINVLKKLAVITERKVEWFFEEEKEVATDAGNTVASSDQHIRSDSEMIYQKKYEKLMEKHISIMEENALLRSQLSGKPKASVKKAL